MFAIKFVIRPKFAIRKHRKYAHSVIANFSLIANLIAKMLPRCCQEISAGCRDSVRNSSQSSSQLGRSSAEIRGTRPAKLIAKGGVKAWLKPTEQDYGLDSAASSARNSMPRSKSQTRPKVPVSMSGQPARGPFGQSGSDVSSKHRRNQASQARRRRSHARNLDQAALALEGERRG